MNIDFLKGLHKRWIQHALLSDTCNLDFTTIPYWGDDSHLENNWSGKRNKALSSMLTVLAQDPDNGIIDYGNSDVQHKINRLWFWNTWIFAASPPRVSKI